MKAKSIIDAFYGSAPTLSIWNGCSQGGRQEITEAVRFPADFDGIIAGAPAVNGVHLHAGRVAINRAVTPHQCDPGFEISVHPSSCPGGVRRQGGDRRRARKPGRVFFRPKGASVFGTGRLRRVSLAQLNQQRGCAGAKHPSTKADTPPGRPAPSSAGMSSATHSRSSSLSMRSSMWS